MISGTTQAGDTRSMKRTDSAMSCGRIMSSADTCSLTKSVMGVSTNAGHSAVDLMPSDLGLLGQVRGHRVYVEAIVGQPGHGRVELLRPAGGHRQRVTLLREHSGDRQTDAAGRSRDDRCTLRCHVLPSVRWADSAADLT